MGRAAARSDQKINCQLPQTAGVGALASMQKRYILNALNVYTARRFSDLKENFHRIQQLDNLFWAGFQLVGSGGIWPLVINIRVLTKNNWCFFSAFQQTCRVFTIQPKVGCNLIYWNCSWKKNRLLYSKLCYIGTAKDETTKLGTKTGNCAGNNL